MRWTAGPWFLAAGVLAACGPRDTGGELVSFHAYASGLSDVDGEIDFDTGAGFHVRLSEARMHLGAVYWRLGKSNPGSANASCVGDTTYGLEVPGGVDVDVLSARLQEFSVLGNATTDLDQSGEIWLVDGDINAIGSTTVVVAAKGVASRNETSFPFEGSITIGQNRLVPPSNPAQPGENPICKQRIIAPIPLSLRPAPGGDLLLRVDPRSWLGDVDFSTLSPGEDGTTLEIPDATTGSGTDAAAGRAFFIGATGASAETYRFSWIHP
ncbi:MAG TPA: hypothetical protein VHC69_21050 [Polyangiaceae bacterium]|nr:hypothetical protein [Polyangiaceae bacterium]